MIAHKTKRYTVEEFDEFIYLPENVDKEFEFIGGEILEVVSNSYSSEIAATISAEIRMYIKGKKLGRVTGADGGYIIAGERYIPDVAFISIKKQPLSSREAYNPNPPDLVVEVVSPSDSNRQMKIKVANYMAVGAIVWVVYPETHDVEVFRSAQAVQILGIDDTLAGGDILPGFTLPVKEIFPKE
jgi:Uma2 family endonuclease